MGSLVGSARAGGTRSFFPVESSKGDGRQGRGKERVRSPQIIRARLPSVSEPYGMHVEFTAAEGRGDELAALLLEAAAGVSGDERCRLYLVSRSPEQPETVFVTEAWDSREAHDESLQDPVVRAMIGRARELMAGAPSAAVLRPLGGKGLG